MPAIGGRQPITYQFRDYTGELKSMRAYVGEITAVSLPGLLTGLGDLQDALDAITLGVRAKQSWGEETVVSNALPTSKYAQIESELLVQVQGATTEAPWSFRIPTIDADKLSFVEGAKDAVIISGAGATAEVAALVAAIEATLKMPDDEAEAVVVTGMRFVGSNS